MPFLEPLSKAADTFRGEMWQLFVCILIDRYVNPAALSPAEFSGKIHKFLQSLAAAIISLTHMLPAWLLALTLCMCTAIHIVLCFHSLEQ